jgi:hypothetical protein
MRLVFLTFDPTTRPFRQITPCPREGNGVSDVNYISLAALETITAGCYDKRKIFIVSRKYCIRVGVRKYRCRRRYTIGWLSAAIRLFISHILKCSFLYLFERDREKYRETAVTPISSIKVIQDLSTVH